MLTRVVLPSQTEYQSQYRPKTVPRERTRNCSLSETTGHCYCPTQQTLYRTDVSNLAATTTYHRHQSFKMELYKLPPEYSSTVKEDISTPTETTTYRHFYGIQGEHAITKKPICDNSRTLSKSTRAFTNGTTKGTHNPPGYKGHIPYTWNYKINKRPHEDPSKTDILWQYHTNTTGCGIYVPSTPVSNEGVKRTSTTYRDMCDELGYNF